METYTDTGTKVQMEKLDIDAKLMAHRHNIDPEQRAKEIMEDRTNGDIGAIVDPQTNQITTDPTKVLRGIAEYFKGLLGTRGPARKPTTPWLKKATDSSPHEGKWSLESNLTVKELKTCLRDIKNSAAPGIDGTPAGLFR